VSQMNVAWLPFSREQTHASSRIRALQVERWLYKNAPEITYNTREPFDVAVHFKRANVSLTKAGVHVLDVADNHLCLNGPKRERLISDLAIVDAAICGTEQLAWYLAPWCDKRIEVIPDSLDEGFGNTIPAWSPVKGRLLWFGSWGTKGQAGGMTDLLLPDFVKGLRESSTFTHLVVCSNDFELYRHEIMDTFPIPTRYVEWSLRSFPELLASAELVVLPVTPTPFTLAKSHNRVTTAIRAGVPCLASQHPAYEQFGVCTEDWATALRIKSEPKSMNFLNPFRIETIGQAWKTFLLSL